MKRFSVLAAMLSLTVYAATAQANLLDDGSFELATDSSMTSNSAWSLTDTSANGPFAGSAIFSTSAWAASDGNNGVWFQSFNGAPGSHTDLVSALLTQTVSGVAAGDYTLTFDAARETNHLSESVIATLSSSGTGGSDSVDLVTATFNDDQNMESNPTQFTLSLTGVSAGDDLTVSVNFLNGKSNPGASESLMVDNFNLVPEPMSIALIGLGLIGLQLSRRKR